MWIPQAFITVLFRPFPWEVHNVPALIQSFDGLILGVFMFFSRGRLFRSFLQQRRNPIIVFAFVLMLMSVIALATLGNFGLLARQRVIVLPFLFFMICAAEAVKKRRRATVPERRNQSDLSSAPQTSLANEGAR